MRILTAVTVSLVAAACGGGSKDPPVIIDSAPIVDQPPAAACPICGPDSPCTVGGMPATGLGGLFFLDPGPDGMVGTADDTGLGDNDCQMNGAPAPCDFFQVPDAGANMGKNSFVLIAGIPNDIDGDGTADFNTSGDASSELVMGIEIVSGNGGVFVAGMKNFVTNPAAITSAQIFATPMGTVGYDAIAYIINVTGTTINSVYISTSGSVTTTAISDTQGQPTNGSVNATNFAETDGMVTGDCTTSLDSLDFKLVQGTNTFQKPHSMAPTGPMAAAPTAGRAMKTIDPARAAAIRTNLMHFLHRN